MLKLRVITALILVFVLAGVVFLMPPVVFIVFVAFVCLAGAWEWSALAGIPGHPARALYVVVIAACMGAIFLVPLLQQVLPFLALPWWMLAFWLILDYPKLRERWTGKLPLGFVGLFIILPSWSALLILRDHPFFHFLFTLMVILISWTDIGAYFSGKAYGRRKLAAAVSPNKTWEGFVGGILTSTAVGLLTGSWLLFSGYLEHAVSLLVLVIGCMLLSATSVVGDLLESLCKRERGLKDSGNLLPGHGGILDRIDSFTAATPLFVVLLMVIEGIG